MNFSIKRQKNTYNIISKVKINTDNKFTNLVKLEPFYPIILQQKA